MRRLLLLLPFLFMLLSSSITAQPHTLSDKATVSLLTVKGGQQLYSLYGHTALRIADPVNNLDAVYNFGYFDFNTPNFYLKFIKGDLQYFAAVDSYADFYNNYVYEQRAVYEQFLNLPPESAQRIYSELNEVLNSERRYYTYKFIDRNCTTMIADIINKHTNNSIAPDPAAQGRSYRQILFDYQQPHFFENLGINIMFGSRTDETFDHNFLPLHLLEGIKASSINGLPLSDGVKVLNKESFKAEIPFWNNVLVFTIPFILVISLRKKPLVQRIFLVVFGLMGLFLISTGLFSLHEEVLNNLNVLLFNPLFLLLAILQTRIKHKAVHFIGLVCAGMLIVYVMLALRLPHFSMFIPMIASSAVVLYEVIRNAKKHAVVVESNG